MSKTISQLAAVLLPLSGNEIIPATQLGNTVQIPLSSQGSYLVDVMGSEGGNGVGDAGKLVKFGASGEVTSSVSFVIAGEDDSSFVFTAPVGMPATSYANTYPLINGKILAVTDFPDGSVNALGSTTYPVASALSAGSLRGYLDMLINGEYLKIPYYNP